MKGTSASVWHRYEILSKLETIGIDSGNLYAWLAIGDGPATYQLDSIRKLP